MKWKFPSGGEAVDWVPLLPDCREEKGFRPAVLPPGRELSSLDPVIRASRLGPMMLLNEPNQHLAVSQKFTRL